MLVERDELEKSKQIDWAKAQSNFKTKALNPSLGTVQVSPDLSAGPLTLLGAPDTPDEIPDY